MLYLFIKQLLKIIFFKIYYLNTAQYYLEFCLLIWFSRQKINRYFFLHIIFFFSFFIFIFTNTLVSSFYVIKNLNLNFFILSLNQFLIFNTMLVINLINSNIISNFFFSYSLDCNILYFKHIKLFFFEKIIYITTTFSNSYFIIYQFSFLNISLIQFDIFLLCFFLLALKLVKLAL